MRIKYPSLCLLAAVLAAFLMATSSADARNGRPARWCGWYMRTQVSPDPGVAYNLARNWAHYGSPARGPAAGVIVVWPWHVSIIVGYDGRNWVTRGGNEGGRVRTGPRSLHGVIAYRWPGGGYKQHRVAMR